MKGLVSSRHNHVGDDPSPFGSFWPLCALRWQSPAAAPISRNLNETYFKFRKSGAQWRLPLVSPNQSRFNISYLSTILYIVLYHTKNITHLNITNIKRLPLRFASEIARKCPVGWYLVFDVRRLSQRLCWNSLLFPLCIQIGTTNQLA